MGNNRQGLPGGMFPPGIPKDVQDRILMEAKVQAAREKDAEYIIISCGKCESQVMLKRSLVEVVVKKYPPSIDSKQKKYEVISRPLVDVYICSKCGKEVFSETFGKPSKKGTEVDLGKAGIKPRREPGQVSVDGIEEKQEPDVDSPGLRDTGG